MTGWRGAAEGATDVEIVSDSLLLVQQMLGRYRVKHPNLVPLFRRAKSMSLHFPKFKIWSKANADIERIAILWRECLDAYGGPFLFGELSMADAMYAPVVSRFRTYGVALDRQTQAYADRIWALPAMVEWREAALGEVEEIEELQVEF